ncbi:MAG: BamA/TamA family outer membrane protein [Deltaproteobacteria bacterium]|nr:BamA/TamA family outer membrane protein [Deltaproteobacteria bacterium]
MNLRLAVFAVGVILPQAGAGALLCTNSSSASNETSNKEDSSTAPAASILRSNAISFPAPHILEERGTEIGKIEVDTQDIFNKEEPGEGYRLYRLANRLHRRTRDRVIEKFLLLEEGTPYSRYEVEESARILRSQRYLYDATIEPIAYDGKKVDLRIRTRDVWTLKVGASLSRSGGENNFNIEVQDSNFLGTGKEITLKRSSDVDRSGYKVRYIDPNLLGTRAELELNYGDNDDGRFQKLKFRRRFFSLDSRRAGGLEYVGNRRTDSFYDLGTVQWKFDHDETFAEAWTGISKGLIEGNTHRWLAGVTFEEHKFSANTPVPTPFRPLEDRTLSYPWLGFQLAQDRYLEAQDINLIGRTEDLALGHNITARIGWSSPIFGANRDQLILEGSYSLGLIPAENHVLLFDSYLTGRWGEGGEEDVLVGLAARYHWRNMGQHALFATLRVDAARELDPEKQLLLGGDSGLRGYPLRYQFGDRRALLTLEQRFYTPWHPLRLAHVGAAVFVDIGKVWTPGTNSVSDQGTLIDVGFGLRLSPSRSGFGSMVHLDVAFPLTGEASIDRVQFLISTKETF